MKKSVKVYRNSINNLLTIVKPESRWIDWQKNNIREFAKYVIEQTGNKELKNLLAKFESKPSKGNPHRASLTKLVDSFVELKKQYMDSITKKVEVEEVGEVTFKFDARVIKNNDLINMASMKLNVGSAVKLSNNKPYYLSIVK